MFKRSKKVDNIDKNNGCNSCACIKESGMPSECFRQQYEITIILGEQFYNKDLKVFLFAHPKSYEVLVSTIASVSFITDDPYYMQNIINRDGILKASIIKQDAPLLAN